MTNPGYLVKIFISILMTSEVKMHLNHSEHWQEDRLLHKGELEEVVFQEKSYLGFFISSSPIEEKALNQAEQLLKDRLHLYCPKLNLDKHATYLFPHLFLS